MFPNGTNPPNFLELASRDSSKPRSIVTTPHQNITIRIRFHEETVTVLKNNQVEIVNLRYITVVV